jgi:hypothetical protein
MRRELLLLLKIALILPAASHSGTGNTVDVVITEIIRPIIFIVVSPWARSTGHVQSSLIEFRWSPTIANSSHSWPEVEIDGLSKSRKISLVLLTLGTVRGETL